MIANTGRIDANIIFRSRGGSYELHSISALLGGIGSQEVVKVC